MTLVDQKYFKIYEKGSTGCAVQLEIVRNNLDRNRVIVDTEHIPFRSQGSIEGGHEVWNKSAKRAIENALSFLKFKDSLDITIKKVEGRLFIDTNNAAIGVACILALFQYIETKPETEMMDKIHEFVIEDWENEVKEIPNFNKIFEK